MSFVVRAADVPPTADATAAVPAFSDESARRAFEAVVRRYGPGVFAVCHQELRHRQAAEDATQAVFLAFAKARPRLGERVLIGGWLFQAARYVCANLRRSELRRRTHETAAARERAEAVASPVQVQTLHEAIARLGRADREVITLRYLHDLPTADLAAQLNLAEPAVRKRLSRAVGRLRDLLTAGGGAMAGAAGLALLESTAETARAAPAHLADSILTVAGGQTAVAPAVAAIATKTATIGGTSWAAVAAATAGGLAAAVGAGVWIHAAVSTPPPTPTSPQPIVNVAPVAAVPPVAAAPQAPEDVARERAADGDYLGAMKAYVDFLDTLNPGEYRDKKTFEFLVTTPRRDGRRADEAAVTAAVEKAIAEPPDDRPLWAWRLHRLRADIAKRQQDVPAERKHLDAAIAAYPADVPDDSARLSSLQHLYNARAMIVFDDEGADAAIAYLADRFRADDRFVWVFDLPWEDRLMKVGGRAALEKFVAAIEAAAADKPNTHRAQIDESLTRLKRMRGLRAPTTGGTR